MNIQVLPSEVADQIAAGEVVERPASVVKECVENSLDAGAKNISVYIERGGRRLIEIRDDGSGMSSADAEKCFLRHATSKISKIDDLFSVRSFGFRGEALAAIASVARVELITKISEQDFGSKIKVSAGKMKKPESVPANKGTILKIEDLFFATPARLQYLKTEETEYRHILKEIQHFALACPEVGFKLYKEGKLTLDLAATPDLKKRIQAVENRVKADLIPLEYEDQQIKVSGYICHPHDAIKNKNHQYLFVNGRAIDDYRMSYAVREVYAQTVGLENQFHPLFVLFLDVDPILVDVNVHPRKLEVKFSDPREIYGSVKKAVTMALDKIPGARETTSTSFSHSQWKNIEKNNAYPSTPKPSPQKLAKSFQAQRDFFGDMPKSFSERNIHRENVRGETVVGTENLQPIKEGNLSELKLVGQVANKYIVAEADKGVYFFDQHALHERQRFEKLYLQAEKQNIRTQNLLIPERLTFSENEVSILHENQKKTNQLGFEITFPEDTVIEVKAVPVLLEKEPLSDLFDDLCQYFEEDQIGQHSLEKMLRKILEYKSCRGSVMFGDRMERAEMQQLLDDFASTKWRLSCPHGRPNHFFWSFEEMAQKFHR